MSIGTLVAFALEGDYKNNLLKVDVSKTITGQYKVDLYTLRPYNSPLRVIKKSDTSYYLLLPETYHSVTSVPASDDIQSVDVKLFPYVGQDLNNGYTKITITTLRPLEFIAEVKASGDSGITKIDPQKLAELDSIFGQKSSETIAARPTTQIVPARPAATQSSQSTVSRPIAAPTAQPQQATRSTTTQVQMPKETSVGEKVAPTKDLVRTAPEVKSDAKTVVIDVKQEDRVHAPSAPVSKPASTVSETVATVPSLPMPEFTAEDIAALEALNESEGESITLFEEELAEEEAFQSTHVPVELSFADKVKSKLRPLYYAILHNFAIVISLAAILLLSLALLFKKARRAAPSVGIQPQVDVMQNEPSIESGMPPVQEEEPIYTPPGGFQAVLEEPTAQETSEEPVAEPTEEPVVEKAQPPAREAAPSVPYVAPDVQKARESEAQILTHAAVEPNRGFYLARFEGRVSLLGYIGEELFVIYTFKDEPKDKRILYRLSEQTLDGNFYLVKVDSIKMLVRSTRNALGLELLI
ncbi:hypothetical protein tpqmel_0260 [Candidatus Gastranaerophilus sp. (ex Termes propinquus)]|nr:hypothetical protein tpqmel_0260 [Candidatus Gastranaerophilus sp. (ex Termes propinquus)]